MNKTLPKLRFPKDSKEDVSSLAAERYGTKEMCDIFGAEKTFEKSLFVQAQSIKTISELYPNIIPKEDAKEIENKANLKNINPNRIRELEEKTGHDIIAINTALEEVINQNAKTHINKFKTSADTTQPAKALQLKEALEVIIDSVENLRDIVLEKSIAWINIPHMDTTHLYDALPTVVGRPFSFYAEMLQSDLVFFKFVYNNSLIGKWSDATGNHHSATTLNVDGRKLQDAFCSKLGLKYMDASAQVPGQEYEADIFYALARLGATMNNLARYIAWGRSDDVNIFINTGQKKKGSSAMPHKDAKRGNPTAEEQVMSIANYLIGNLTTAMTNCQMSYARDLSASSNSRINIEDGFKFLDHGIRRLSQIMYDIEVREERAKERVLRSLGCPTSQQVMTYLTDGNKTKNPLSRGQAHELLGKLATYAWDNKIPFVNVVLDNAEITSKIDKETIKEITNPFTYIGQSKEIVKTVFEKYHLKKTL